MKRYNINFYLIKLNKIDGISFDDISHKLIIKDSKYTYDPIKNIDEKIENHFTQILFLLKEYFTDSEKGFIGWNNFTKKDLLKLFDNDKEVYINEFINGKKFVEVFPNKITYFLNNYCYKIKLKKQ